MLRRNSPIILCGVSAEAGEGLWWERFVKKVGFEPGVKADGVTRVMN